MNGETTGVASAMTNLIKRSDEGGGVSKYYVVSEEELVEALDAAYMEGLRDNRPSKAREQAEATCRARKVVTAGIFTDADTGKSANYWEEIKK